MRRVARLKNAAGVLSARVLFIIGNIKELESSMQQLSLEEGEMKAGLKIALGTLVKQCSSILIDHLATSGQKTVADEIREFREVFVAPIHYAKVMAAAEYRLWEKRQRQTRKPSNLPKEDELGKLLTFIERNLLYNCARLFWPASHCWMRGGAVKRQDSWWWTGCSAMSGWKGPDSPLATRRCCNVTRWRLSWARETLSCQYSSPPTEEASRKCS